MFVHRTSVCFSFCINLGFENSHGPPAEMPGRAESFNLPEHGPMMQKKSSTKGGTHEPSAFSLRFVGMKILQRN